MAFVLGLGLAAVVGLGLQFGSGMFSKDKAVIHIISIGVPVFLIFTHTSPQIFIFNFFLKN